MLGAIAQGTSVPRDARSRGTFVRLNSCNVSAISANPRGFYLNIHTRAYPRGAIRGQLHR